MLIYRQQLENLLEFKNKTDDLMISLYLNVIPNDSITAHLNPLIHNTRNKIKESLDKDRLRKVDRLIANIEEYATSNLQRLQNTQLVVIFADTTGFWQEFRLPVSFPGKMVVEAHPYIRPLSLLLDEFHRYLILVTDSRHTRLFSLYLGDFEEHPDIFIHDEVPDRVRTKESMAVGGGGESIMGVFSGVGDKGIEDHIKEHFHRHLRDAADKTFEYFKKQKFTRLIIGTPDDRSRPWLKGHLHSYLQERLAGEFTAQPTSKDSDLKQLALKTAAKYEREQEIRLVDMIFEKSSPGNLGLLGIDPVIKSLAKGQVHTLAIERGYRRTGYICYDDHTLSSDKENCPLCNRPMSEVNDLIDEMVEVALMQNAEVRHIVSPHEEFQKYHAGAILRFAQQ